MASTTRSRTSRFAGLLVPFTAAAIVAAPAIAQPSAPTPPTSAAGWVDGDADWQHDSYNRLEHQLGVGNVDSLRAGPSVAAPGRARLGMPTIARGSVLYFGSWTPGKAGSAVEAHAVATGKLLWRAPASDTFSPPFTRQPKYLNGRVYVTASGGETPSSIFDRTAALDAGTGRKLWEVAGVADVAGYGQLFVRNYSCDSGGCWGFRLTAYDAVTGAVTWHRSLSPDYVYAGGYSGSVLNAGILYFGEDDADGHYWLRAVDARTGDSKWSTPAASTPSAAAVDAATGTVLVSVGPPESARVSAVVGATGHVRWSRTGLYLLNGGEFWLPGGTSNGAVAVGQGIVYSLCGATSGAQVCATRLSDGRALAPAVQPPSCSAAKDVWTSLALANGVLYATSSQCGVVAINTATRKVIGTVVPGVGLLRPEVAGGRLYAGTQHEVTAWQS